MSTQLDSQIEQARQAAAQVAEIDAQRAAAESLPVLEAQQAALARRDAARAQLDTTKAAVMARLLELRDKAQKERARTEAVIAELRALEREIPATVGEIRREQKRLQNAVTELEMASRACGSSLGIDAVYSAWSDVGGHNVALNSTKGINPQDYFRKLSATWPIGF